jgi:hypothetical protein
MKSQLAGAGKCGGLLLSAGKQVHFNVFSGAHFQTPSLIERRAVIPKKRPLSPNLQ